MAFSESRQREDREGERGMLIYGPREGAVFMGREERVLEKANTQAQDGDGIQADHITLRGRGCRPSEPEGHTTAPSPRECAAFLRPKSRVAGRA